MTCKRKIWLIKNVEKVRTKLKWLKKFAVEMNGESEMSSY